MGTRLQLFLLIAALIFLSSTIYFIRKKGMDLYRSIMWFVWAGVLLIMAIFPALVSTVSSWVGIATPSNFVFLVLTAFLLITCLSLSASLSRQHLRIKQLVQSQAILENRLEKAEQELCELKGCAGDVKSSESNGMAPETE